MSRNIFRISLLVTFVTVALASCLYALLDGSPGSGGDTVEEQLSGATGLAVRSGSLHWVGGEPAAGLTGAVMPSEVLFLASRGQRQPADLFMARVRLGGRKRVVKATGLVNLTDSEAGDDYLVSASGRYVAVATRALQHVRSLTIFDLEGYRFPEDGTWDRLQRVLASVTNLQRTGRLFGVGRMSVRFVHPPTDIEMMILHDGGTSSLVLEWDGGDGARQLTQIDLDSGRTSNDELEVHPEMRLPKRPILWLVDTVRAVPWIGPGPIEWAEGRFFDLKDRYRRFMYEFEDDDPGGEPDASASVEPEVAVQDINLSKGLEIGEEDPPVVWPPPEIEPPVFKRRRAGEGTWTPAVPDFVRTLEGAPPAVYETYVRTDPRRPYVKVHLLAMDMRQLELHMVAGHEDPRSTTGATGTGRLPDDPAALQRVVAAFNGAFKTEHGAYGMMVDGNVLLPPQDEAATVATYSDGSVAMGSWPKGAQIPEGMTSYRQNMDPLVEDGVVNPRKRYLWGFTLDSDIRNMNTIRSGVCMNRGGNLVYAWGEDLTATTLGAAMNAAGCGYGMHLDMNPFHTSFIFYHFNDGSDGAARRNFKSKLVFPEMKFSPRRYVNGAPKDFFFVSLKDTSPPLEGWTREEIAQPAPGFVPAVFERQIEGARVVAVDSSRARADIFPGEIPEALAPARGAGARGDEALLVEIGLGRWSSGRGQLVNGAVVSSLEREQATLVLLGDGGVGVSGWGHGGSARQAVQGRWIVRDGQELEGDGPAVTIGVKDGWYYIVEGGWEEISSALARLEIDNAVAFEGGGARVLVRTRDGMRDLAGEEVPFRDPTMTTLRILSRPRNLGGRRMK